MKPITVQVCVKAPIMKVWECWNQPEHIKGWAFASDDWEAPSSENDVRIGGKFHTRMQAKDGSGGFDFSGVYTAVQEYRLIEYDMEKASDEITARHVRIEFTETSEGVQITETFDPEHQNPEDMQAQGWQAILGNFKTYVERV